MASQAEFSGFRTDPVASSVWLTESQVAQHLGLTQHQARQLGLVADGVHTDDSSMIAPLYHRGRVLAAYEEPIVVAAREQNLKPVDWEAESAESYGERQRATLDAARAMVRLNGYAKQDGHPLTTARIYALKDRFVHYLWSHGYCTSVHRHGMRGHKQPCRECHGRGCRVCDWDGGWGSTAVRHFVWFQFVVDRHSFAWHVPSEKARWLPKDILRDDDTEQQPDNSGALELPNLDFPRDYALVQWVTQGSCGLLSRSPP